MKLFFLRHAEALDGPDDAVRPLSKHGEKQSRDLARFSARAGIQFDAAYSSPLVRAVQTAELVLAITNDDGKLKLERANALLNEITQSRFSAWLRKLPAAENILLVGHAPSLPERVCRLLGDVHPAAFKMAKGGLACLDTDDGRTAVLKLFLAPKWVGS